MKIVSESPFDANVVATELASSLWEAKDGRRFWNHAVRTTLSKLGKENSYLVYPSDEPGFLLDLIWMDKKTGAIHLAVESEMGTYCDVLHDFQKLWCVKSAVKIMVYYLWRGGSVVAKLEKELQDFDQHLEGEHYILLEFADDQKRPEDAIYHFHVRKDNLLSDGRCGRVRAVKFSRQVGCGQQHGI